MFYHINAQLLIIFSDRVVRREWYLVCDLNPLTKASCLFRRPPQELILTKNFHQYPNNWGTQVINIQPFPTEVNVKSSCIIVHNVHLVHIDVRFVTAELLCRQSRVRSLQYSWRTAPCTYLYDKWRPYQPRACFLFRLSLRVDPFLRWPAVKSFSSTHRFQLGKYGLE